MNVKTSWYLGDRDKLSALLEPRITPGEEFTRARVRRAPDPTYNRRGFPQFTGGDQARRQGGWLSPMRAEVPAQGARAGASPGSSGVNLPEAPQTGASRQALPPRRAAGTPRPAQVFGKAPEPPPRRGGSRPAQVFSAAPTPRAAAGPATKGTSAQSVEGVRGQRLTPAESAGRAAPAAKPYRGNITKDLQDAYLGDRPAELERYKPKPRAGGSAPRPRPTTGALPPRSVAGTTEAGGSILQKLRGAGKAVSSAPLKGRAGKVLSLARMLG